MKRIGVLVVAIVLAACPNTSEVQDAGRDAQSMDAGERDADIFDAKTDDALVMDAGEPIDTGATDATEPDAEEPDAEPADAGEMDAEPIDVGPVPECAPGSNASCRPAAGECDVEELCDGVSDECPEDVFAADGTPCTGCPAGTDCAGCFGGSCLDSRTFCSDILARGQSTGDGVYVVRPAVTSSVTAATSTVSVFCDMTTDGGGWTMVFKKSRIVPGEPELLWSGPATNRDDVTLLDRQIAAADYSNAFQVDYWGAFTEARVEVVTGTVVQQFIQFDLTGTDLTSWFAADRHVDSSWTDLPTSPTFDNGGAQAFRIGSGRSFYINRLWGGCPFDRGWLMISTIDFCFWEQLTGDPADIIYSLLPTESLIPDTTQTGHADTFVIFLR